MIVNEYWLVFKQGEHWVTKLFKKDCSHVGILTRDKYNWIWIDPLAECLQIKILPYSVKEAVPEKFLRIATQPIKILKVRTFGEFKNKKRRTFFPALCNCISVIKYVTQIHTSCWTPWQLYKKLTNPKTNLNSLNVVEVSPITTSPLIRE
jgi:hypothetical protein